MTILKKIFYAIIKFIKVIITAIWNFILSLFNIDQNKTNPKKVSNSQKINTTKILPPSTNQTSLPETPHNLSQFSTPSTFQNPHLIIPNHQFPPNIIDNIIEDIIKPPKPDLSKPNLLTFIEDIDEFKEIIIPKINQSIIEKEIDEVKKLQEVIEEIIKEELHLEEKLTLPTNPSTLAPSNPQNVSSLPSEKVNHSFQTSTQTTTQEPIPKTQSANPKNNENLPPEIHHPKIQELPLPPSIDIPKSVITPITISESKEAAPLSEPIQQPETTKKATSPKPKNTIQLEQPQKEENTQDIKDEEENTKEIETINQEINNFEKKLASIATIADKEQAKENLEDKIYKNVYQAIDNLLTRINDYIYFNSKKLSSEQRTKLERQKNRLQDLKENIKRVQQTEINNEKRCLEEQLTQKEKDSFNQEIKNLYLENQLLQNEELLKKLEHMRLYSPQEIASFEKQLIKNRLHQMLRIIELPAILAVPFIKNRYFSLFTIGLLIHNHFRFLNNLFLRKPTTAIYPDWDRIHNGSAALNEAIELTYSNLTYIDNLYEESISKYPELAYDLEFIKTIQNLKEALNNSYQKLTKKQEHLTKTFIDNQYKFTRRYDH